MSLTRPLGRGNLKSPISTQGILRLRCRSAQNDTKDRLYILRFPRFARNDNGSAPAGDWALNPSI